MCEILELNRSSYYKWLNRKETEKEKEDQELCQIILEYYNESNKALGYRMMRTRVNRLNHKNYNVKRIRRLMRLMGISSVIRRKKIKYLKTTPQITAENVLNREFVADAPNTKWLTDVTEFKVIGTTRKLYLSAIIDLFDGSVVSYVMGTSNNNELVFKTFDKAIEANPGAKPLFHSDRGYQYTNRVFKTKLDAIKARQSMSRVGRCIDNGPMEGFWSIIKCEMYYLQKFHSIKELTEAIEKYINYYNKNRFPTKLKGLTPIEYRNQALLKNII